MDGEPSLDLKAPMSPTAYFSMGLVLTIEGVLGMLCNGFILAVILTSGHLRKPRSILNLSQSTGDFGIAAMCPFAALASFKEEWIFGDQGCQLYAFLGMFFGTVSITSLAALAVDKYYSATNGQRGSDSRPYVMVTSAIWLNAALWATTPLSPIAWGRYSIEPPKTTCMLDFGDHSVSYVTYLVAMMGVVFVAPITFVLRCLAKLWMGGEEEEEGEGQKADKNKAFVMCIVVLTSLVVYWGAYGIVAVYAAAGDITNVPILLVAIAPILAKICPIGNAVLQVLTNQELLGVTSPAIAEKQK